MSQSPTEPAPGEGLVHIGRIVKPHGLRGDVVVELTSDRDERLAPGSRLTAGRGPLPPGSAVPRPSQSGEGEVLVVERATCQRPASGRRWARWIVGFAGCAGIEAAEGRRGTALWAEPLSDPDVLWVDDLVGADVVLADGGDRVGSCVAVVANPAADLLELDSGALVPVTFIVASSEGRVVVDPPAGLFDL